MKVLLFTTTDCAGQRQHELNRLIESVRRNIALSDNLEVRLHLLFQRSNECINGLPSFVHASHIEGRLSLSLARNFMIRNAYTNGDLAWADVVAFPDDDGWYPAQNLKFIVQQFENDADLSLFICRYGSEPISINSQFSSDFRSLTWRTAAAWGSSNTMFFRATLMRAIGEFDPKLGVGASLGGGEDTDYVLRGFGKVRKGRVCMVPIVGHRDPDVKLRAKYYVGGLVAIAKRWPDGCGARLLLARKIAVGLYYLLRKRHNMSQYGKALRMTLRTIRSVNPTC